ncbi:MAG: potassium transporter TrkA [Elusimicrobia bacterium CG_4_9_14_3_um_filter_62_55]|nr:MAG: potassium transporter TrkA [Elusimicrobia bacterium CG22_combo_CG10-13_8_21_14_all_63_91]PJA17972.1 MAG: potassium transporter TrkA [Elusimicrobia bacterium CG_4_10_14_0_2_um_filter_63_34]PJB26399.1 MAG: potassium transporter TrkA [Elusimicrobia bacterium CG_4_9_14_3_um_filter_62_55]
MTAPPKNVKFRLMTPILSLLVVLAGLILVMRLATIMFVHTGLSVESASFQALSALSGVGFTTAESEKIVNHPVRRRILFVLLLAGNAGIVTAVSSLILTFMVPNTHFSVFEKFFVLAGGIVFILILAVSPWTNLALQTFVGWLLRRYTRLDVRDYSALLRLSGEYQVGELYIKEADWLVEKDLATAGLHKEGILVLGIRRQDGTYIGVPGAQSKILAGDLLLVYGRESSIAGLDERVEGRIGDIEHFDAIEAEKQVAEEEKKADPAENGV